MVFVRMGLEPLVKALRSLFKASVPWEKSSEFHILREVRWLWLLRCVLLPGRQCIQQRSMIRQFQKRQCIILLLVPVFAGLQAHGDTVHHCRIHHAGRELPATAHRHSQGGCRSHMRASCSPGPLSRTSRMQSPRLVCRERCGSFDEPLTATHVCHSPLAGSGAERGAVDVVADLCHCGGAGGIQCQRPHAAGGDLGDGAQGRPHEAAASGGGTSDSTEHPASLLWGHSLVCPQVVAIITCSVVIVLVCRWRLPAGMLSQVMNQPLSMLFDIVICALLIVFVQYFRRQWTSC